MIRMKLEETLHAFYTLTRMEVAVLDRDFHTITLCRSPDATLCTEIHRNPGALDLCKASDIDRLTAVRDTLSPMLYTCPFGITEAIVPILRDDTPIGYLISTAGVERGTEAAFLDRCTALCSASSDRLAERLSPRSTEELQAAFRMLQMLAAYLAGDSALSDSNKSIGQLTKRYIKNNLGRKLTLRDIAKNLHCSTVTLTEHFKAEFGITVNAYIVRKRMEYAELLLLTTDHSLREIASTIGFSDVEYFSRTFKHHYGDSPARWRRSTRKSAEESPE